MAFELQVPRHMRSPGDEGYRTPTIEDAERTLSFFGGGDSSSVAREVHTSALESALQRAPSRMTDQITEKEYNRRVEDDSSRLGKKDGVPSTSKLSWKERIRHVTWAYFTVTMATGGLANVLYEGKRDFEPGFWLALT